MGEPAVLGFIGLGAMGGRTCGNLARKSGKPVIGYGAAPARIAECTGADPYRPVIRRPFES